MVKRLLCVLAVSGLVCSAADAETRYFKVAEWPGHEDHGDSSDQERSPLWPHARHFCGAPFPGVIGNCICRSEMLSFRFYVEIER